MKGGLRYSNSRTEPRHTDQRTLGQKPVPGLGEESQRHYLDFFTNRCSSGTALGFMWTTFSSYAAWELRILSQQSSLLEVITLGCFLIATMASLRFRDSEASQNHSASKASHILRGISWRTETSVSGQPWGVCCIGIAARPSTVVRFL